MLKSIPVFIFVNSFLLLLVNTNKKLIGENMELIYVFMIGSIIILPILWFCDLNNKKRKEEGEKKESKIKEDMNKGKQTARELKRYSEVIDIHYKNRNAIDEHDWNVYSHKYQDYFPDKYAQYHATQAINMSRVFEENGYNRGKLIVEKQIETGEILKSPWLK